jgi:cytochrome c
MRLFNLFCIVGTLAACSTAWAQKPNPNDFGRPATQEDIAKLDFSINPVTGAELPPGKGTAKEGAPIFAAKCAVCHGPTGQEGGLLGNRIVGPKGTRGGIQAVPFASTIWDFIHRAMPRFNEGTLTNDQIYSLTALLLFRAEIISEDEVIDQKTLPKLQMPNRYGYVPSDLAEIGEFEKRGCRLGHCPGPDPVAAKGK